MNNIVAKLSQISLYFALKPLLFLLGCRFSDKFNETRHGHSHIVFISNHLTLIDFIIVSASLKLKDFLLMPPLAYIAANKYLNLPIVGRWMRLNGSFPVKQTKMDTHYGIEGAIKLLKKGRPVLIFPEGQRVRGSKGVRIRTGVKVITQEFEDLLVAPVLISKKRSSIFNRLPFTITIGEAFDPKSLSAEEMMQKVWDIPNR